MLAGPQAGRSSLDAGLSGRSRVSVTRRSAGLPGFRGTSGSPLPAGRQSRPSNLGAVAGIPKGRPTSDRPALDNEKVLAGLVKQSVPGRAATAEAKISPGFSQRQSGIREKVAQALGATKASEKAVELGLQWLTRHQHADGRWSIDKFHIECKDHKCTGHGSFQSDTAATGLALLAFYGSGYTHQSGKHNETVSRGLNWLLKYQKSNGDLFHDETQFVWFYSHGMAAIAVCEAYGMTKDPNLRQPAQKALGFIVESQHPDFGGWRYRPRFESDTSVSGWQVMALKSGELAGLTVPRKAYEGVTRWLDSVENKRFPGQYAYHPTKPITLAMTAEGLLMRQYLGAGRNDPSLIAGGEHLRKHLPEMQQRDVYYWYYATQVMFHLQGAYWSDWNDRMRDLLKSTQLQDGGPAGSWNPDRPTVDKWSTAGGRLYVTCLNILILEVYYRHLPLYIQLEK